MNTIGSSCLQLAQPPNSVEHNSLTIPSFDILCTTFDLVFSSRVKSTSAATKILRESVYKALLIELHRVDLANRATPLTIPELIPLIESTFQRVGLIELLNSA